MRLSGGSTCAFDHACNHLQTDHDEVSCNTKVPGRAPAICSDELASFVSGFVYLLETLRADSRTRALLLTRGESLFKL